MGPIGGSPFHQKPVRTSWAPLGRAHCNKCNASPSELFPSGRNSRPRRLDVSRASYKPGRGAYGDDLEPQEYDFGDLNNPDAEEGQLSIAERCRISQISLIESWGLPLGAVLQRDPNMKAMPGWNGEDDDASDDTDRIQIEDFGLDDDEREESEEEDEDAEAEWEEDGYDPETVDQEELAAAQLQFDFEARRRFEKQRLEDAGFELHHAQMERSAGSYVTTMDFATTLEQLQQMDQLSLDNATAIPIWIRATFALEEVFDERNEQIRQALAEGDAMARAKSNYLRDPEEMARSPPPAQEAAQVRPAEKLTLTIDEGRQTFKDYADGYGDDFDSLLNVLPGVIPQNQVESDQSVTRR